MKKILISLIAVFMFTSCYKEEALNIPIDTAKYNIKDDPSNPLQHQVYLFYQKYKTVLITNPTVADYVFNFNGQNMIRIVAPQQNRELLLSGVEFIKQSFVAKYSQQFIDKNFPFSIILADSIQMKQFGDRSFVAAYGSSNFVAISGINQSLLTMTEQEKKVLVAGVHGSFWGSYMSNARGLFKAPESFYAVSDGLYQVSDYEWGFGDTLKPFPTETYWYERGFVSDDPGARENNAPDDWFVQSPDKVLDLNQWMEFIFLKTPAEMKIICDTYPKMKQKYEILTEEMKKLGYDPSIE